MDPLRWQQIDQLFHAALKHDRNRRAAFLSGSCGGDELLRDEIESLISIHEEDTFFMETPASDVAAELLARDPGKLKLGENIGRYTILSSIGDGGMGTVYLAQDNQLERQIALKLLPAQFTINVDRVRRFEQEARAASALNHPNIVTIYEIGHSDSSHFIATEFIDGETLRQRLTNKLLSLNEALDIALQIANALSAAHSAGIVHRDIKPENIMLRRDGFVKVLDFGIAKLTSQPEETVATLSKHSVLKTNPGLVMGTVQYMSPEQARGFEVDARTDVWSLGVLLYEMVSGRMPFEGETRSHVIVSILEREPPPLGHEESVPSELNKIIDRALRKNRGERFETASDMVDDLRNLKQDLEAFARLSRFSKTGDEFFGTTPSDGGDRVIKNAKSVAPTTQVKAATSTTSSVEYFVEQIKRHKRGAVLVAAAIALFTTLGYLFYVKKSQGNVATSAEPINSLAILPFVNSSGDPNTEYVADGISDSVINSLSRLPRLRVVSLNTVMRYKGKPVDPQKLGRDLNVNAVLMGRMTLNGEDLSINAELVDVRDNRRLWGEQYNQKLASILSVQEEIARKISESLRLRLSGEERERLEKQYTHNHEAYLLYSLGRYQSDKNTKDGWKRSIGYYEQAIKLDPEYALAYVGLSRSYHLLQHFGFEMPKETLRTREWAALKAVELDDTLSEAHAAVAEVKAFQLDWEGSEREAKRAFELDPNSFDANRRYATNLAHLGRTDEALVYAKRAYELDPKAPPAAFLGYIYLLARQYDEAIKFYSESVKKAPDNASWHFFLGEAYVAKGVFDKGIAELQKATALDNAPERWDRYPVLAYAYAVSGQRDEAMKILAEQKRLRRQRYIDAYNFAIIYTGLGDADRAFEYLNKSFDEGRPLVQVPSRPLFDSLRGDPRYTELLRRMKRL